MSNGKVLDFYFISECLLNKFPAVEDEQVENNGMTFNEHSNMYVKPLMEKYLNIFTVIFCYIFKIMGCIDLFTNT